MQITIAGGGTEFMSPERHEEVVQLAASLRTDDYEVTIYEREPVARGVTWWELVFLYFGKQALDTASDQNFRGYEQTELNTQVLAAFDARHRSVDGLAAGEHGFVALAETPFYLESGGQISDVGTIRAPPRIWWSRKSATAAGRR